MFDYKTHNSHPHRRHRVVALKPILVDTAIVLAILFVGAVMWKGLVLPNALPFLGSGQANGAINVAPQTSTAALIASTYDPKAQVRADAVKSLGESGDVIAVPRLRQLQLTDGNESVQQAARRAEDRLVLTIGAGLNLPPTSIKDVAVASSGIAYVATMDDLYARHDGTWQYVNHLPDSAIGLALTPDAHILYLATASEGLYRSENGGKTWQYLTFGLSTPTRLIATAIAVDPTDAQRIYIALVTPGLELSQKSALGIFWTEDAGETWRYLRNSPSQAITTRLIIDANQPGYLFGLFDDTPWRYTLPSEIM